MISRPPLRWHGGKWNLAPWIIEHFPSHRTYVEPFGGGASVLLRKARSYAEIYNDLNGEVVNFFAVLRSAQAEELVRQVAMTPFSRDEFKLSYQHASEPVERARRLVVRSFMGFGTNAHERVTGFRFRSRLTGTHPARDWRHYPHSLIAVIERLRGVVIENRPAIDVMRANDGEDTLHYLDPPYLMSTRDSGTDYSHEMSDADHELMIREARQLTGMVVISGYPSELYSDLLHDWYCDRKVTFADGARKRTELLYISPNAAQLKRRLL